MNPRHVFTEINGLRLHHLDYGGTGPVTLLIHGVLGQAWMWAAVASELAQVSRVISIDLRGYGDSQWSPDGKYPTSTLATDTVALADHYGWDSVRVVGFSLGGLVGLAIAERKPELVEKLVLIDLPPSSAKDPTDLPPITMNVNSHGQACEAERRLTPNANADMIDVMASHGWKPAVEGSLERKHDSSIAREWSFRSEDWWDSLEQYEGPLLFVHGGASQVCSRERAEEVVDRAMNGSLVEVEGAGHLIPIEQPSILATHLLEFIS